MKAKPFRKTVIGLVVGLVMSVAGGVRAQDAEEGENLYLTVGHTRFCMVYVEGGVYMMGGTAEQKAPWENELPAHKVMLGDYYIGQTEVTQGLWNELMGSNDSQWQGDSLPVEEVSWTMAQAFVIRLNQKNLVPGYSFALPTEAQWEYAARGGRQSRHGQYSGSNNIDEVGWYYNNSGMRTHAVGKKRPNELGIYDMTGNVRELVADGYGAYEATMQRDPFAAPQGLRVFRGGSWNYKPRYCRNAFRGTIEPGARTGSIGFRLALIKQQ